MIEPATSQGGGGEADPQRARLAEEVRAAQRLAGSGNMAEAERMFAAILERSPGHRDALNFLGVRRLAAKDWPAGFELLKQALQAHPGDALTLHNLGMAHEAVGDFPAALASFQAALVTEPRLYMSRLHYALSHERLGNADQALRHYYMAIRTAQRQRQWLNPASTAPSVRPLVEHALRLVEQGQRGLVMDSLQPLREQFGDAALTRVHACLDHYLGSRRSDYPDPRQLPNFLYFPDLPPSPYLPSALFPWIEQLEAQTDAIRNELLALLRDDQGRERVFETDQQAQAGLRNAGASPVWDGFYFYRHGRRNAENCERCPQTFAALSALPLAHIREHGPEIMFSVLSPGTHLLPHRGDTNIRSVVHLPLIVPDGCALNVGGELHAWQEGRCVAFDDTYEHEAWNRGLSTRVVLILDTWNPYLTEVERVAATRLIECIGDFNKSSETGAGLVPDSKPG